MNLAQRLEVVAALDEDQLRALAAHLAGAPVLFAEFVGDALTSTGRLVGQDRRP